MLVAKRGNYLCVRNWHEAEREQSKLSWAFGGITSNRSLTRSQVDHLPHSTSSSRCGQLLSTKVHFQASDNRIVIQSIYFNHSNLMAPLATPGEPREGSRPEPVGNIALVVVFTTCTLSLLYLLWRRASSLRAVVSHQLKTWTTSEGRIRLSEDDGPSAAEFLTDHLTQPLSPRRTPRHELCISTSIFSVVSFPACLIGYLPILRATISPVIRFLCCC
ncbi:hypothetical protein F5I97DRAFT_318666 [Phlebopus sp. FC_14]|nr:hypothetical protein F5I97DRAFT_318666 [Phlebopus sp. FC_14]